MLPVCPIFREVSHNKCARSNGPQWRRPSATRPQIDNLPHKTPVATGLRAVDIRNTAVGFYIISANALIPCIIMVILNIMPL